MKKTWIFILTFALLFSSCSKNKDSKNIKKESRFKQVGETSPDFNSKNFKAFEKEDWNIQLSGKVVDKYDEINLSVIDVYQREKNIILISEGKNSEIIYAKVSGNNFDITNVSQDETIDEFVIKNLNDNDELWGYQKFQNYYLIIKNNQTYIYKDGKLIHELKGIGKITDIDGDGKLEIVCKSDEKKLIIYSFNGNSVVQLWEYVSENSIFNGNIQIDDMNGDGVKELYVGDTFQNMRKFVLTDKGFAEDDYLPIKQEGKPTGNYYFVDYNGDGKTDIIVTLKDVKPSIFIQSKDVAQPQILK